MTLLSMLLQRAERPSRPERQFAALSPHLGESERHTYTRVATAGEKASLPAGCPRCGAPEWVLCRSATGLPASAPCPERVRAVST